MAPASDARRITTNTLQTMKQDGEKIAMLTAYDYSLARLVDGASEVHKMVLARSYLNEGNDFWSWR